MSARRRCDDRCHKAKGDRCGCWCGGTFHGSVGAVNREALKQGTLKVEDHGFEEGKTVYLEQTTLPGGQTTV